MALAIGGRRAEAERAYGWLADCQRPDGSWHQYYLADSIEQDKLDANVIAYMATGVWHHHLLFGDDAFVAAMWPTVESAIDFVLDLQTPRGEILWARHADGTPWSFALLTGSSSICHSLRCAIAIAEHLGHERPDWELSAARLAHVITAHAAGELPDAFAPKHRWAMDWYYPVMTGVLARRRRPRAPRSASRHVLRRGHGRPLRQRPALGHRGRDLRVPAGLPEPRRARPGPASCSRGSSSLRNPDGHYFTGIVFPEMVHFPGNELSTYTSASIVLAADALAGPVAGLAAVRRPRPAPGAHRRRRGEPTWPPTPAATDHGPTADDPASPSADGPTRGRRPAGRWRAVTEGDPWTAAREPSCWPRPSAPSCWCSVGAAPRCWPARSSCGTLGVAIAFGLTLLCMAYAIGGISGCHINPAVTVGLLVSRQVRDRGRAFYFDRPGHRRHRRRRRALRHRPQPGRRHPGHDRGRRLRLERLRRPLTRAATSWSAAIIVEIVLTALLVFVVASTFHKSFPGGFGGVAVGLVLTLIHLISIPVDNTSVNPARSLGVAVFQGGWALKQLWVFIVFPLIGGALGALLWRLLAGEREPVDDAESRRRRDPLRLSRSDAGPIRRSTRSEPTARSSRNDAARRGRGSRSRRAVDRRRPGPGTRRGWPAGRPARRGATQVS